MTACPVPFLSPWLVCAGHAKAGEAHTKPIMRTGIEEGAMSRTPALRGMRRFVAGVLAVALGGFIPHAARAQNTGCPVFPPDNVWNTPVESLPVHSRSDTYITAIGKTLGLHPDFGTVYQGAPNGIPF